MAELQVAPLAGRRLAVTGANRGIGRALVEAFAAAGASVLVHARRDGDADATLEAVRAIAERAGSGGRHEAVAGDLRDDALPARLAAAGEALGGLDGVVMNAGVLGDRVLLGDIDARLFDEVMDVNVNRQLRIFQALLPQLLAARGTILWMSTGLGRFALPRYAAYCASKHALEGLAKTAAVDYGDAGLVSIAVSPGMVQTDMLLAAQEGADISAHELPEVAARRFVRILAHTDPAWNGESVELGRLEARLDDR